MNLSLHGSMALTRRRHLGSLHGGMALTRRRQLGFYSQSGCHHAGKPLASTQDWFEASRYLLFGLCGVRGGIVEAGRRLPEQKPDPDKVLTRNSFRDSPMQGNQPDHREGTSRSSDWPELPKVEAWRDLPLTPGLRQQLPQRPRSCRTNLRWKYATLISNLGQHLSRWFFTPIPCTYTSLPLDGAAMNFPHQHGFAR